MKTSSVASPVNTPIKILLIGPPGSRKTSLMLQFPGIYVEDCDRNLTGPETWLRKHGLPNLSYSYNPVRYDEGGKMREIDQCYNALCDDLKLMAVEKDKFKDIKVVGVDSLSHVNEFIIRHTLTQQNKSKKTFEMEARDWSPFKSYAYIFLVARLEEINKPVICTCHEIKLVEGGDPANLMKEKVIGYEPFFQGKVGDVIGAFFTDVWRLELRPAPGDKIETWLQPVRSPKCEHLKNSIGLEKDINITEGFKVLEPYLKGRL